MGSNGVTAEVNSDSGDIDAAVKTVAKVCPTIQLQRL